MNGQVLFGRRIRAIREAASLSRELVAEKADINVNYLGEIERGEKWPSLEVIEQLAKALTVSPVAFFEFEAEEIDPSVLLSKLQDVLANRNTEQLQQALRILKALFEI
jgi:transcriptional regulator with XRE-family HTH domain